MRIAVVVAALMVLAGCTASSSGTAAPPAPRVSASSGADRPMAPLGGNPLAGSGLRVLVTGAGAYLLEVDSGRRTAVAGLPRADQYWGFAAGRRTVVAAVTPGRPSRYFVLDGARARPLAEGLWAFAARDGSGVWVTRSSGARCTLREVPFSGTAARPGFPIGCDAAVFADSALGLLVNRSDGTMTVLSRENGRPLTWSRGEAGWQVLGTAERAAPAGPLALVRSVGGSWGADGPGGSDGAGPSRDPASESLGLLDPGTRRVVAVGTPATEGRSIVAVPDAGGRMLAVRSEVHPDEADYAAMVAVWRPGDPVLRVKRLPLAPRELAVLTPQ
ncbi:hypothetical protein ACIBEJ_27585 [Nonomuraea sp. NPDC050790]|uniref:hypothetical protein n=1 Tax=Nonomuraea sp. NPDC050790 TaxID=3364371 RepID=UPI00379F5451